jgi:ATP-dependent Clp protease protease subunit
MTDASTDRLLEQRIVQIQGEIDEKGAIEIIARLLYLQHVDNEAPVRIVVDSPGGSFIAGMAILQAMDDLGPPIYTRCSEAAGGMALAIVAHGAKGHRTAGAEAHFRFAQIRNEATRNEVSQGLEKGRQDLVGLLVKDTGRTAAEVRADMETERSLTAAQALADGIIDRIDGLPGKPQNWRPL